MNFAQLAALANKPALQRLNTALPAMVSIALVITIGYALATLSWQLYQSMQPAESALGGTPPITPPATRTPSSQSVRQITRAWLFGKPENSKSAPVQKNAPVTKLNLVLRGVLAADPDALALAIIAKGKGKSGKEEIYGIGDTIQHGVTLREIHPDHIIIERNGRAEKLVMPKSKGGGSFTASASKRTSSDAANATSLRDIRQQIMKNPTSFGDYALPIVVKENGKQIGYRLRPQKKGHLLQQYGLMPNDIITEINGVKLDKPQNGIKALRELSSASSVSLTVKRGQSYVPLDIQLQ